MKKKTVRIALIMNADETWHACGWSGAEDDAVVESVEIGMDCPENCDTLHWIEAVVPVPVKVSGKVIKGKVKK